MLKEEITRLLKDNNNPESLYDWYSENVPLDNSLLSLWNDKGFLYSMVVEFGCATKMELCFKLLFKDNPRLLYKLGTLRDHVSIDTLLSYYIHILSVIPGSVSLGDLIFCFCVRNRSFMFLSSKENWFFTALEVCKRYVSYVGITSEYVMELKKSVEGVLSGDIWYILERCKGIYHEDFVADRLIKDTALLELNFGGYDGE